ncbi:FxDxF family PEP-CTERM protein [Massilia endophytica]|uniref:FxDxF family PEP-CTERM protein n=1 Tax=Massilia endophytica TaxID=2899220 RepID=UPI001E4CA2E9|nr:FxDxF family PEP-CTERM protein [Massilia endophytica]UGQ48114.1 FxDxF family PEP-CTERM protein [Massilia endophytica]
MKKMLLSKVAGSLLLTAGLLASTGASAQTTLSFDAMGNAVFGMTHATPGDNFEDEYLFSVDAASMGWASGTAVVGKTFIDSARLSNYAITEISFFRVEADSSHTMLSTTFSNGDAIEFYPNDALMSGNYGFMVTGNTAIPDMGGAYAGTLNLQVVAVPEPATYAMLGIGVGLLAFTARRKSNNKLG